MTLTYVIAFILCLGTVEKSFEDSSWQMDWHTGLLYHVTKEQTPDTFQILPQDSADAKAIVDSKMKEEVIAGIMAYRESSRRSSINAEIKNENGGNAYVEKSYKLQDTCNPVFKDLIYVLCFEEYDVMARYLANFLDRQDETWIIMAMVLTNDIESMTIAFDNDNDELLKIKRHKQRKPFRYMIKAWCQQNRESDTNKEPDKNCVAEDAKNLKAEQDSSCWVGTRDQLELVTMRKSAQYAKAVIQEYQKLYNCALENVILDCVNKSALNHDLGDGYISLIHYLKNAHKYIASILHQYCDGTDRWAAWLMCIKVVSPEEWPKINDVFKAEYKESLSQFIVKKASSDPIFAETIAAIVDSSFKPTKFAKIPTKDESAQPCGSPPPSG